MEQFHIYTKTQEPQVRECEIDAKVGLRGYISYFQDVSSYYLGRMGLGNDMMPEKYRRFWLFTKYSMHVTEKSGFGELLDLSCFATKSDRLRLNLDLCIRNGNRLKAEGRLEICLFNLDTRMITRLSDVPWNPEYVSDQKTSVSDFTRTPKFPEDAELIYDYRVRYTDLDNGHHMNNLHYVDLFMNAFDVSIYEAGMITDFELHYLDQTFFGDTLSVYRISDGDVYHLFARTQDKRTAAYCSIRFQDAESENA